MKLVFRSLENRQGERTVSSAAPAADFRSSCEEVRP
jgi:hypothetical protein